MKLKRLTYHIPNLSHLLLYDTRKHLNAEIPHKTEHAMTYNKQLATINAAFYASSTSNITLYNKYHLQKDQRILQDS